MRNKWNGSKYVCRDLIKMRKEKKKETTRGRERKTKWAAISTAAAKNYENYNDQSAQKNTITREMNYDKFIMFSFRFCCPLFFSPNKSINNITFIFLTNFCKRGMPKLAQICGQISIVNFSLEWIIHYTKGSWIYNLGNHLRCTAIAFKTHFELIDSFLSFKCRGDRTSMYIVHIFHLRTYVRKKSYTFVRVRMYGTF